MWTPGRDPSAPDPAGVRCVYLWAGRATVDLLRVKFPDLAVDEPAHRRALGADSAAELAGAGFNRVFLSFNWGFPPEVERDHWREAARAFRAYREAGFEVAGYVQTSNCVAEGSYAVRDWYARTPRGRRIPYYRDRLMTCWNHDGWIAEVERRALRVARAGAGIVFFDNLWMGAHPWLVGGRPGGFAGCACARCRRAFREATGHLIPRRLREDAVTEAYLEWRAGVVRRRLAGWSAAVRSHHPGVRVSANLNDVELRDTRALFGIVPGELARVQDEILVENVAMPEHRPTEGELVGNALPLKALRAEAPDVPLLGLPYQTAIGVERRPDPGKARRAVAETVALGASPVVKGTEYLDSKGRFTVLTCREFEPTREAVGAILRWVAAREELFRDLVPAPEVGIFHDLDGMRRRWGRTAPPTFAVACALLREGVSFRFVPGRELAGGAAATSLPPTLLVPPGIAPPLWSGSSRRSGSSPRIVKLEAEDLDVPGRPGRLSRARLPRAVLGALSGLLADAYFSTALVRRTVDRTGLTRSFLRSRFFRVPERSARLRELLPPAPAPRFESTDAFLVERWRRPEGGRLVHLVNYEDVPIAVWRWWDEPEPPRLHSPDAGTRITASADRLFLDLECFAVLEWRAEGTRSGGSTPGRGRRRGGGSA